MLKIGDFSTLAHVSIKTLRYYDEAGVLTPVRVDPESGYRYYAARQIAQLYRILVLKDFGFSLEEIGKLLQKGVTAEQMRGMLVLQQAEQQRRVEEEADRLSRISSHIRLIEKENDMSSYDVILKTVPKQKMASVRETIANYPAVGALCGKVAGALGPAMAGKVVAVAIWHDPEYKEKDVDAEAGFYLQQDVAPRGGVTVHDLPEVTAACTVHNGAYRRLNEAYDSLMKWVAENGYQIAAPIRELYLQTGQPGNQDDDSCVTEIQVPVRKAA